ncbi:MAG: efflux RND transporter periplasmic adaptor subunit, partial [Acidiferrobacterales bacterium]
MDETTRGVLRAAICFSSMSAIGSPVRNHLQRLNVSILLVSAGALLAACEELPPPEPLVRPVRVQQVTVTGAERQRSFSGFAKAGLESNVSFKVEGTVQRIPIKVGDRLRRGALIAQLDPKDYEVDVQKADAALAQARAEERNAKASYQRVRELYENNNASRSELDEARAASEATVASVRAADKQLESARLKLSYTRLTASANCNVAARQVDRNENV